MKCISWWTWHYCPNYSFSRHKRNNPSLFPGRAGPPCYWRQAMVIWIWWKYFWTSMLGWMYLTRCPLLETITDSNIDYEGSEISSSPGGRVRQCGHLWDAARQERVCEQQDQGGLDPAALCGLQRLQWAHPPPGHQTQCGNWRNQHGESLEIFQLRVRYI